MPAEVDVVGAVSAIIWAMTLIGESIARLLSLVIHALLAALLKYAIIALQFGSSQGEGGPFA